MQIAVISSQVFPCPPIGYAGLEMVAWHQAKGLAQRGHGVTLIAPEGSWCPGCSIHHSGPPGVWNEKQAYDSYWQILRNFDCIIDNSWQKWAMMLQLEGTLKIPVLKVMHAPVDTMLKGLPAMPKPTFVCISKDQAVHFEALFSHPARVAYNGVDPDYYKPLGMKRSDHFLFLARFSSIKGPDLAIEACLKAGAKLDLVGDTQITNEPDLHRRCMEMAQQKTMARLEDVTPQIRVIGDQLRSETLRWYSQSHVMLHPNEQFREPFGLAPIEAMLCGMPVIAWDKGAMRETIKDGETGRLIRSMDELVETIKNLNDIDVFNLTEPDRQVRNRCRDWAAQFSTAAMAQRYEELCVEACNGGW